MAGGALSTAILAALQPALPVLAFPAIMLCATILAAFALLGSPFSAMGDGERR